MSNKKKYLGITIDYERDNRLSEKAKAILTKPGFYMKDWEKSPQESFARAATCFSFGDYQLAQDIYDAVSLQKLSLASPTLSNSEVVNWPSFTPDQHFEAEAWFKRSGKKFKATSISCFLLNNEDTSESLVKTREMIARCSMMGGGVGTKMSIRSLDTKSSGVMAHVKGMDADINAYRQSKTRKGSMAVYLDIDHPEILNFLRSRDPLRADHNSCFNIFHAVCIPDYVMYAYFAGDKIELIDPKHGPTGEFVDARDLVNELCDIRFRTGAPFIKFPNNCNRNLNPWITNPAYKVVQSNLCTEVLQMTTEDRAAVCALSSYNLAEWDSIEEEIKESDRNIIRLGARFVTNVLEMFKLTAPPELDIAIHSAKQENAIGMGTLGFHSYLQSKNIAFESGGPNSASSLSHTIYKTIKEELVKESKQLAKERGEAPDCAGSGMHHTQLMAVAPNVSSSDILNSVSPGIDPYSSNAYLSEGRVGAKPFKNPYLKKVLKQYGKDTSEVWSSIIASEGSVQHLDFLSEHHKEVYKTAWEINPLWVINLASIRTPHICQGQSTNIYYKEGDPQMLVDILVYAWQSGLKTLYYHRSSANGRAGGKSIGTARINHIDTPRLFSESTCLGCDG